MDARAIRGRPKITNITSPNAESHRPLKSIKNTMKTPLTIVSRILSFKATLTIIFLHPIFPLHTWKHTLIMSLYKNCGNKSVIDSYRPISLSSCIRKLLAKVVRANECASTWQ